MNNKTDKTSREKILGIFFDHPTTRFHIRELARVLVLNPNTVSSAIKAIKKENLVVVEKKRHVVEVSANISAKEFIRGKRAYNFSEIYNSGLVDFLERHFSRDSLPDISSISVIGSYSQGEDIEKSDIDIVVIARGCGKKMPDLSRYEKELKRRIHLIVTDYKSMSEEFFNNLINGMLLYGYLSKK